MADHLLNSVKLRNRKKWQIQGGLRRSVMQLSHNSLSSISFGTYRFGTRAFLTGHNLCQSPNAP
jgi:hypothetical protein